MIQTRRLVNWIGGISLCLGVIAMLLFCGANGSLQSGCGVNLLLWSIAGMISLVLLARAGGIALDADGGWLAIPVCFFAATFIWREDSFLQFWNTVLMLVSGTLLIMRCRGPWRVAVAGYTEYIRLTVVGAANILVGPLLLISDMNEPIRAPIVSYPGLNQGDQATEAEATPSRAGHVAATTLKGVLLSVVPLSVFGALFSSADPVFQHVLDNLFDWNIPELINRTIASALFALLAIGILRAALIRAPLPDQAVKEHGPLNIMRMIKAGDVTVALALIAVLFAAFVAVQFRFLFGGVDVVSSVPGLTYSSYARGGFFELAWVAGLTLPVLLLSHWLTSAAEAAGARRVRWLTGLLTALMMVIVASAFKRMALYEDAWGLTEKRLLVSVFIGAISVVFFWFLATVWRGRPKLFAFGLLIASILTIAGLDLINTDAIVVNVDARRLEGLQHFPADYLADLGADAVPALTAHIASLSLDQQPSMAQALLDGWGKPGTGDWRIWNASDAAARRAVIADRSKLAPLAAKAPPEQRDAEDSLF